MTLRRALLALSLGVAALAGATASAPSAFADAGPHQVAVNNGTSGLSGDCAACHRAHTAQASDLLQAAVPGLCLRCHDGTGATTDVVDGIQYVPDGAGLPTSSVIGALRSGGFSFALLDSSHPARLITGGTFLGKVGVLAAGSKQAVTSTHGGNGTVWGNGSNGTATSGAGTVTLSCTSCHNPHGNGQYRILETRPGADWTSDAIATWQPPTDAVEVQDVANPTGAVLNYTVLPGTLASNVAATYSPTQGDYWRLRSPWNSNAGSWDPMQMGWNGATATNAAANNGVPVQNTTGLMTAWCVSCHTRYSGLPDADYNSPALVPQPDDIFTYRHMTGSPSLGCEQCHVSHGSNALMTTGAELRLTNPDGSTPAHVPGAGATGATVTSADSRLLKVDERGTCQLCHDPTGRPTNGYVGPVPTPGVP